jgi:hypothetical protein
MSMGKNAAASFFGPMPQGIAFIVAVLLMHMGEEDAFITLTYLLNVVNLREIFMPVMEPLLICLFQFSRILAERY